MPDTNYRALVDHYESCLKRHGDTHLGVDWPSHESAQQRYQVMLELVPDAELGPVSLLDFGCGTSQFYDFIARKKRNDINCPASAPLGQIGRIEQERVSGSS